MFRRIAKKEIFNKTATLLVLFVLLAPATVSASGNSSPSLTGVDNETISICDSFDAMNGVSATDADGDAVTISVSGDDVLEDALSSDTPGTYTLSYTADDNNGGFDLVDRDITVEDDGCAGGGNNAPSLVGADNTITLSMCDTFDALSGVSATDTDGDAVTIDFDDTDVQDALLNDMPGTYIVTYIADDGNGGTDIVDRTVIIDSSSCGTGGHVGGNTAPSLTGVNNLTLTICDSFDAMNGVSATDADGDAVTIDVSGDDVLNDALDNDTPGTYTLSYTADDNNGGFDFVDRVVTVTSANCGGGGGGGGGSNSAPSLIGVDNVTITVCDSFDVMNGVSATDTDGDAVTISVSGGGALADALSNDTAGAYTVTYTATDGNGGSDIVDRVVTVTDANCGGGGGGNNGGGGGGGCINCGDGGGGNRPPSSTETPSVTPPTPQVLGATTSCSYLNDYLRRDFDNNPFEVMKLQAFLRVFEGLDVEINGVFDQKTFDAVETFQIRYNDDVLNPWGYSDTHSTGYVYILTKKKVNEIFCDKYISLTAGQQQEINGYRDAYSSQQTTSTVVDVDMDEVSVDTDDFEDIVKDVIDIDNDKGQSSFIYTAAAGFYSGVNSLIDFLFSTCFLLFLLGILLGWLLTEWYKGQKETKGHNIQ